MEHIAIMNKSWKLIDKILSGEKTIESRWYKMKRAPWNKIKSGDIVYFKDAGELVSAKAVVDKVLQFELDDKMLREILDKYSSKICFKSSNDEVFNWARDKKYCILIFLKSPERVEKFEIDKTGYGIGCAWISTDSVDRLRKTI